MAQNSFTPDDTEHTKDSSCPAREKIKRVSKKLFAIKGFPSCGIRSIAREAGVNIASINYYFNSKENLFRCVVMESIEYTSKEMCRWINNTPEQISSSLNSLYNQHANDCELLVQGLLIEDPYLSSLYQELQKQLGDVKFSQILGLILLKRHKNKLQRPAEIVV